MLNLQVIRNQKINENTLPESIKSALSKMEALMPRLALVLQFMENVSLLEKVLRKVTPMKLAVEQRELLLLKSFCFDILSGLSKEMVVQRLLEQGYANYEIAQALNTSRSNISYLARK